jgi:hypothetical protein
MLNYWHLTAVLSAIIIQFVPSDNSAIAQEREGCFLVNSAGEVINLNQLCSLQESDIKLTGNDGKFIEDYKGLAKSYSPEATDNLLQATKEGPVKKLPQLKECVRKQNREFLCRSLN